MRGAGRDLNPVESRAATDLLLGELRTGRWRVRAWRRFFVHATRRSADQARRRPRALAEVTLVEAALFLVTRRAHRHAVSWTLAVTHLSMLGPRDGLGVANVLTLLRAGLSPGDRGSSRWFGLLALVCDWSDGRIARATCTETPFGAYADPLADVAFWTRFADAHESSRVLRCLPILVWGVPIIVVAAESVRRGHMVDYPRPALLRLGTAVQLLVGLRATVRSTGAPE